MAKQEAKENRIYGINGPVVTLLGDTGLSMMEMVLVGDERLVGEVIGINDQKNTIQVYENTTGLRTGEPVYGTGGPLVRHPRSREYWTTFLTVSSGL